VIKKPRERGGHSPRWAAEPEMRMMMMMMMMIIIIIIIVLKHYEKYTGDYSDDSCGRPQRLSIMRHKQAASTTYTYSVKQNCV
jgi:hypothetical protein